MIDEHAIGERFRALAGTLDERQRRLWAAAEARSHGRGGIAAVARASGLAENTIRAGLRDLDEPQQLPAGRVRKAGAGPKRRVDTDKTLLSDLKRLVDGDTRGDPERPLLWTSKSVRKLAAELRELGHEVSYRTVARLLHELGYSLQANRKTKEGSEHPDRDAQFAHINDTVAAAISQQRPAISIDTKKKELVGEYANGGREWRPKGEPVAVNVHDFPDKTLGKAIPYGIYDIGANHGFVNVGITKETAAFAVASIRSWWQQLGSVAYPDATTLQITADCGGANANRVRLWKTELQRLADDTALEISVCHFPPATSKWNRIEHRL
ncbi:MAG: ISAzo13 family transposase, partial [Actinobacteria bacterium]|nr:ISAzo13 family transposase [Actinomycetota bacterium]